MAAVSIKGRFDKPTPISPDAIELFGARDGLPTPWLVRAVHKHGGIWLQHRTPNNPGDDHVVQVHRFRIYGAAGRYERLCIDGKWKPIACETWQGFRYRPFFAAGHPMDWAWAEMVAARMMGAACRLSPPLGFEEWLTELRGSSSEVGNYRIYLRAVAKKNS